MTQLNKNKRYHFIGIGGIGMSGLALICLEKGYEVSGSDIAQSDITTKLTQNGADIFTHHDAKHIDAADIIVYSSAISKDNPEYKAAVALNKTMIKRAELLAQFLSIHKHSIAVTGAHGKTTVTSLLTHVLHYARYHPGYVIGGLVHDLSSHAQYMDSDYMVAEADESDASFLYLNPQHIILTNIDADHMHTYDHDDAKLAQSFNTFVHRENARNGSLLIGIDGQKANQFANKLNRSFLSYGFSENASIQAVNYQQTPFKTCFDIKLNGKLLTDFCMKLPGKHNVENALAVIGMSLQLGVDLEDIKAALASFGGIKRRFDCYTCNIDGKIVTLVDDYGHHPNEVQSTLSAIYERFPEKSLIHIFQPHRYTRTADLFDEFVEVLNHRNRLILMDVYAAGEEMIQGATAKDLSRALSSVNKSCYTTDTLQKTLECLASIVQHDDIVLVQGAGNVAKLVDMLI
ncbi:UDP-N-acetylmuramate--L-alanine ligase [Facilibium subflavum]|uniref:UDP-N-acetylmuramate--L-alanine ligase n=1 Tax=Facilibium subflavum TaxID=2219058 RepID=UPI000E6564D0|nr:UDP-N-acetylmuramate--L-alanine ligase [Facilibium subflavum]